MELTISTRHGNLHESDRQYIEEKLPKLNHMFDRIMSMNVTVDFENNEPEVELILSTEHKNDFVASDKSASVRSSFDGVMAKMEKQIRRYKDKIQKHNRKQPDFAENEKTEDESVEEQV